MTFMDEKMSMRIFRCEKNACCPQLFVPRTICYYWPSEYEDAIGLDLGPVIYDSWKAPPRIRSYRDHAGIPA